MNIADRRRRLTIAALVLLILGGGLWWSTRPQIDPRLVGTWFRHPRSTGPLIRIFNADGHFKTDDSSTTGRDGGFWRVEGSSVFITPPYYSDGPVDLAKEFFVRAWHRIQTGTPFGQQQFRIVEVGDGRLRIQGQTSYRTDQGRVQTYYMDVDRGALESLPKSEQTPVPDVFNVPSPDRVFGL
jgi:hypothetical protein